MMVMSGTPIRIPVVYGIDDRFAIPLAASIESALDHLGDDQRLDIYIVDGGISARNHSLIRESFGDRACRLTWLRPDAKRLDLLKVGGAITLATYYRLLIPRLLPTHIKKAIYLDADLIVRADLGGLWRLDPGDKHLLAVQDQGVRLISGPYGLSNYRTLGIPDGAKYFNAGVLIMNLEQWRRDATDERILNYVREQAEFVRFHDQDGLNAILWNRWGEIDPRWNQMPQILQVGSADRSPFDEATFAKVIGDPFIVHYASADKPWRYGCQHPATGEFFLYLDRTAYRGFRPDRWGQWASDAVDSVRKRLRRIGKLMRM